MVVIGWASVNFKIMSKQTAVDWLIEQLKEYDFADIKDSENYIIKIPAWILTEKQEKAKEMERQQIIKAHLHGVIHKFDNPNDASDNYYNDTFGDVV